MYDGDAGSHWRTNQDLKMSDPHKIGLMHTMGSPLRGGRVRDPLAQVYRVGEPFHPGHPEWPPGAEFAFGPAGCELTLFRRGITPAIEAAVRSGSAEFALIVQPSVIVLAYRFGDAIPWEDAPYSWHLQPEFRRLVPEAVVAPEARTLLWITLVGAEDGIILAQRGMTLAPAFTRELYDAVRLQAMRPFDPNDCTSAISSIYLTHRETTDRLAIAVARTMGNA
jgi:hypothetical protein